MARKFVADRTQAFQFVENGESRRFVLIFGDEVNTLDAPAPGGA